MQTRNLNPANPIDRQDLRDADDAALDRDSNPRFVTIPKQTNLGQDVLGQMTTRVTALEAACEAALKLLEGAESVSISCVLVIGREAVIEKLKGALEK